MDNVFVKGGRFLIANINERILWPPILWHLFLANKVDDGEMQIVVDICALLLVKIFNLNLGVVSLNYL
jgi:hypothetical protein